MPSEGFTLTDEERRQLDLLHAFPTCNVCVHTIELLGNQWHCVLRNDPDFQHGLCTMQGCVPRKRRHSAAVHH